jgi:hypothetical protein
LCDVQLTLVSHDLKIASQAQARLLIDQALSQAIQSCQTSPISSRSMGSYQPCYEVRLSFWQAALAVMSGALGKPLEVNQSHSPAKNGIDQLTYQHASQTLRGNNCYHDHLYNSIADTRMRLYHCQPRCHRPILRLDARGQASQRSHPSTSLKDYREKIDPRKDGTFRDTSTRPTSPARQRARGPKTTKTSGALFYSFVTITRKALVRLSLGRSPRSCRFSVQMVLQRRIGRLALRLRTTKMARTRQRQQQLEMSPSAPSQSDPKEFILHARLQEHLFNKFVSPNS